MALHAPNEAALRELDRALERAGLPRHLIVEEDAPYEGQAMAIGIPPCDRRTLKRYLSRLPLI